MSNFGSVRGYDHNWVLNESPGGMAVAAVVTDSGQRPFPRGPHHAAGVQFYTGNFMDGKTGPLPAEACTRIGPGCVSKHNISPIRPTSRSFRRASCVPASTTHRRPFSACGSSSKSYSRLNTTTDFGGSVSDKVPPLSAAPVKRAGFTASGSQTYCGHPTPPQSEFLPARCGRLRRRLTG